MLVQIRFFVSIPSSLLLLIGGDSHTFRRLLPCSRSQITGRGRLCPLLSGQSRICHADIFSEKSVRYGICQGPPGSVGKACGARAAGAVGEGAVPSGLVWWWCAGCGGRSVLGLSAQALAPGTLSRGPSRAGFARRTQTRRFGLETQSERAGALCPDPLVGEGALPPYLTW